MSAKSEKAKERYKKRAKAGHRPRGRRAGIPNIVTKEVKQAILEAAALIGYDNEGAGGVVGYMMRLAMKNPVVFGGLLGRLIPVKMTAEIKHSIDLTKLSDEELIWFERITSKAQVPLIEHDPLGINVGVQPVNGGA